MNGPRYILPVTESAPMLYAAPGQPNTSYVYVQPPNGIIPPPVPPPKPTNWGAWIFWAFVFLIILTLLIIGLVFLFKSMNSPGNAYSDKTSYNFNQNTPLPKPNGVAFQASTPNPINVGVNAPALKLPTAPAIGYQAPQFVAPAVGYQAPQVMGLPALAGYQPL